MDQAQSDSGPDPTPGATERFGAFELLRLLGSGGAGDVWLARQTVGDSDRLVALKTLRARGLASPEQKERLQREARALLRVDHPGICPIYDVGEIDGTPYIAMRHVPGRTLAALIGEARESRARLQLGSAPTRSSSSGRSTLRTGTNRDSGPVLSSIEEIARALHVAHQSGLVHRDIKPANLMITPAGEPVLLDFGLAKIADEIADLTLTGAPIGTPAYMSPEQISGRSDDITFATDIWSLAVTAYECLTLRHPFEAPTRDAIYRRILLEPHTPLRRIDASLPRDLDAVIETALRKDPTARYRSALEFADDLAAVRNRLPTRARRMGRLARTRLWMRRNRAVTALLFLLAAALATTLASAISAHERTDEAERSRALAESSFLAARQSIEGVVEITRNRLTDVPRFAEGRTLMLGAAIDFYQRFADLRESDPTLGAEVALALYSVGDLGAELGWFESAELTLKQAAGILDRAVELGFASPGSPLAIEIALMRGSLAARAGRIDDALAHDDDAVAAARAWIARPDAPPRAYAALLDALGARSDQLDARGDSESALAVCTEALELVTHRPGHERGELRRSLAHLLVRTAELESRTQRATAADSHYADAIRLLEDAVGGDAPDEQLLSYLMTAFDSRSELRLRADRIDEAVEDRRRALGIAERLAALRADSYRFIDNLASCHANLGAALAKRGDLDEASVSLGKAYAHYQHNVVANPGDRQARVHLAVTCFQLGEINLARQESGSANENYQAMLRAIEIDLASEKPDIEVLRIGLMANRRIASCQLAVNRFDQAESALASAAELLEQGLRAAPNDERLLTDKANFYFERAEAHALLDQHARAAAAASTSGDAWYALIPRDLSPPRAVALAAQSYARECLFRSQSDPSGCALVATTRLAAIEASPPEHLQIALGSDRFRCDLETLRLFAAEHLDESIAVLRALVIDSDPERPRALAAIATIRALSRVGIDGHERAARFATLIDDLEVLTESAATANSGLLGIERILLLRLGTMVTSLPASEVVLLAQATAGLQGAVDKRLR